MAKTPLTPEFREFLSLLNEKNVRYLIIGGYAVGFHGHPRYTKDIELWIASDTDNGRKLSYAIQEFFGSTLDPEELTNPQLLRRIGIEPNMIEIMTQVDGVEFQACYGRHDTVELGDLNVPIIALKDLRANKAASGRHQDLADLENLPPAEN